MRVRRGQVWAVGLDPTIANEQRGIRPCVVISGDRFNAMPIGHTIVVPLTSRDRGLVHHIPVVDDGGLSRPSWAMCEAVRSVSTQRFGRQVGTAADATVRAVLDQVALWFAPGPEDGSDPSH